MAGFTGVRYTFGALVCASILVCLIYVPNTENMLMGDTFSTLRSVYDEIRRKSHQTEDNEVYSYQPAVISRIGIMFNQSIPLEPTKYFIDLDTYDVTNITIVTGADIHHFNESIDAVAGFQKLFPNNRIVYYDLRLDAESAAKVKKWCNVEYRTFNYGKYPHHVKTLTYYGFKGVIIYEMIQEVEAIFWIDASIRPKEINISKWTEVFDVARKSGIVLFDRTGTRIYNFTHPGMYAYLPTDLKEIMKLEMLGSGAVLLYRTKQVYWDIIHWHYLCAMTPDCIIPANHTSDCDHAKPPESICHRYDQSSLAILVANHAAYNNSLYESPLDFIVVHRYPTEMFKLKKCS